jgi:hypothetical protein
MTTDTNDSKNNPDELLNDTPTSGGPSSPLLSTVPGLRSDPSPEQPHESKKKMVAKESAGSKDAAPKKKPPKLDFGTFMGEVERLIENGSKAGSLSQLVKLLKRGYDTSPTPEHVNSLFSSIENWPEASRLALILSVETRITRSPEVMRFLRNRLIDLSHKTTGLQPVPHPSNDVAHDQRTATLVASIQRQILPELPNGKKPVPAIDLTWARWALVSLMEEPDVSARAEGIYTVLDVLIDQDVETSLSEQESKLFVEINYHLSTEKPNLNKLRAALRMAGVARFSEKRMREDLIRASSSLREMTARFDESTRKATTLQESLAIANQKIGDLERTSESKEGEVLEQKTERERDRDHWQEICEQRLTKQASSIKSRLAHEVKEARMALDDETPNIRMALDRLNNIEKALEKLKVE